MENPTLGSSGNGGAPSAEIASPKQSRQQRIVVFVSVIGLLLVLGGLYFLGRGYFLLPNADATKLRDLFIIALTIELFLLGAGTIILIVQLARLINLVQNEVQPVLESANETINTLRGTAAFLSSNLVRPVIKVNGYIAAIRRLSGIINFGK